MLTIKEFNKCYDFILKNGIFRDMGECARTQRRLHIDGCEYIVDEWVKSVIDVSPYMANKSIYYCFKPLQSGYFYHTGEVRVYSVDVKKDANGERIFNTVKENGCEVMYPEKQDWITKDPTDEDIEYSSSRKDEVEYWIRNLLNYIESKE